MCKNLFRILLMLIVLAFLTKSYAQSSNLACPAILAIKHHDWPYNGGWLPLYIDNGELASTEDINKFTKAVRHFKRAEWSGDYPEAGHCFYLGNDPIMQKITLANSMLRPSPQAPNWVAVPPKADPPKLMRCYGFSVNNCLYSGIG